MRMIIRFRIRRYKASLIIGKVTDVKGVNSTLANGQHILMWEFDITDYEAVKSALKWAQGIHDLPQIHVSQSHPGGGFHAYCLARTAWIDSIAIIAGTNYIDPGYVSMCAMRGHWTLRLTDKGQGAPEFLETLPAERAEDVLSNELKSWVQYEVWSKTQQKVLDSEVL